MQKIFLKKLITDFRTDLLFKNSIYLIASTAVMSGLGFFFWLIAANLYTSTEIGIATTIISVISLITGISLLGLGSGVIKYFASSDDKSEMVNSAIWLTFLFSLLFSAFYLVIIPILTPQLAILISSPIVAILFCLFTMFYTLNILFDDLFVAYRRADYIFIKNSVFSLTKMLLLYVFVMYSSLGIFATFGIGSFLAVMISTVLLVVFLKHELKLTTNRMIVRKIWRFSLANYLALFIYGIPVRLIPILITGMLGAHLSAYFYISLMIANFLYVIPLSVAQSLFVEGTHQELNILLPKSGKIISAILIPLVILVLIGGQYLLLFFGEDYSVNGASLLKLLAISSLFIAVNYVGESLLKLHHRVGRLIWINIVYALLVIGSSYMLARFGLIGIGMAFLIGNVVSSLLHIVSSKEYILSASLSGKFDKISK